MRLTRLGFLAVSALVGGAVMGQSPFVEQKGVRELSGRMIVRPFTPSELSAQKGLRPDQARLKAMEAWMKIERIVIRQDPEVGEAVVLVPNGKDENSFSKELMATGLFDYASPDWLVTPEAAPNDPRYSQQWHHATMQSAAGWDIHTGIGVTVAICDTGVDITHPDLVNLLVPGYNAVDDVTQAAGGGVTDLQGHGTHVAGCAAAQGNNGVGVAGVGWGLRIMPVRVSNQSSGSAFTSDLHRGIRWAADNGAKVANLSYSGVSDPNRETTGAYALARGCHLVSAAGNDGADLAGFDWPSVVVVGASTSSDARASFSAFGLAVDCFAPGSSILSTTRGGGYGTKSGTSMAAPVAAGLLALIKSFGPSLTPSQAEQLLYASCDSIGAPETFGAGRINVSKAMVATREVISTNLVFGPTRLLLAAGTLSSGGASSLSQADGQSAVIASAVQAGGSHRVTSTTFHPVGAPGTIARLQLRVTARMSNVQKATLNYFLFNQVTRQTDLLGTAVLTPANSTYTFDVPAASLATYVSPTGEARITLKALASDRRLNGAGLPFDLIVDESSFVLDRRY